MKRILITGANSYIGTSFENYMAQWPEAYQVDTVDMMDITWREKSFSGYDAVFHVAGIAHIRETKENSELFYRINRDLSAEVARKAKNEGVKQFIYLSSMSVYGIERGAVDPYMKPSPISHYGISKLEAEKRILPMGCDTFVVAVLRPPMVYGDGCRGNYSKLVKLANLLPFFPTYENRRSMLSIENLVKFVRDLVDEKKEGLFFPQDEDYVSTCAMVHKVRTDMGKKMIPMKLLNPAIALIRRYTAIGRKAFGDLYYIKYE